MAMDRAAIARVSLVRAPLLTARTFALVVAEGAASLLTHASRHAVVCAAAAGAVATLVATVRSPPAGLEGTVALLVDQASFVAYWVTLGVLSSVGLGSGLHTFVLFLGPHILRVANAAVLHGNTAFSAAISRYFTWPSAWDVPGLSEAFSPTYAEDAWATAAPRSPGGASLGGILAKVAYPAFLWGAGTALGELPPYFVARAAAASGRALEELQEVEALEAAAAAAQQQSGGGGRKSPSRGSPATEGGRAPAGGRSLLEAAKVWVFESIQAYGFVAILLAASIPNPLFDLAGITCGHFGIPFATFFGATLLGKAVIKPAIQTTALVGGVRYGPAAFEALRGALPPGSAAASALAGMERSFLAGQHALCAREADCAACCAANFASLGRDDCVAGCGGGAAAAAPSSWGAAVAKQAWGALLVGMVVYFLGSIVESLVRERLLRDLEQAEAGGAAGAPAPAAAAAAAAGGASGEADGEEDMRASAASAASSRGGRGSSAAAMASSAVSATSAASGRTPIKAASVAAAVFHAGELAASAPSAAPGGSAGAAPRTPRGTPIMNKSQRRAAEAARASADAAGAGHGRGSSPSSRSSQRR